MFGSFEPKTIGFSLFVKPQIPIVDKVWDGYVKVEFFLNSYFVNFVGAEDPNSVAKNIYIRL